MTAQSKSNLGSKTDQDKKHIRNLQMGQAGPESTMNPLSPRPKTAQGCSDASVATIYDYGEAAPNTPKSSKLPLGLHKAMRRRSLGTQVVDASEVSADPFSIYNTNYASIFNNNGHYASQFNHVNTSGIVTPSDDSSEQQQLGRGLPPVLVDASTTLVNEEKRSSDHSRSSHSRPRSSSRGARRRGSLYVANSGSNNTPPQDGKKRRALRRNSIGALPSSSAIAALSFDTTSGGGFYHDQPLADMTEKWLNSPKAPVAESTGLERPYRRTRRNSIGGLPFTNRDSTEERPETRSKRRTRQSSFGSVTSSSHQFTTDGSSHGRNSLKHQPPPSSLDFFAPELSAPTPAEERKERRSARRRNSLAGELPTTNESDARSRRAHRRSSMGSQPVSKQEEPKAEKRHGSSRRRKSLSHPPPSRRQEDDAPESSAPTPAEERKERRTARRRNSLAGESLPTKNESDSRSRRARRRSSMGSQPMSNLLDGAQTSIADDGRQQRSSLSLKSVLNDQDSILPTTLPFDNEESPALISTRWSAPSSDAVAVANQSLQDNGDIGLSVPTRRAEADKVQDQHITLSEKKSSEKKKKRKKAASSPLRTPIRATSSSSSCRTTKFENLSSRKNKEKVVPFAASAPADRKAEAVRRIKSDYASTTSTNSRHMEGQGEKKELKKGFLKKWLGTSTSFSK
eukprot:scaffold2642_cov120-Cylindrotheca_fusiformis.AAC.6